MASASRRSFRHYNLVLPVLTSLLLSLLLCSAVQAERWGLVTIQSTHGYGSVIPIQPGTVQFLQSRRPGSVYVADDTNNSRVTSVLNGLRDGDVLVINTHSNAHVFGAGSRAVEWRQFYGFWNVANPPRLSAVIVHGCIFDKDANGNHIPATDTQIDALRRSLNAQSIISYNTTIHALVGRQALHQLIVDILNGNRIAPLIQGANLRFLVDGTVDRQNATLQTLVQSSGGDGQGTMQTANIAGTWNSSIAFKYEITQTGNAFSWNVITPKNEQGRGTIQGASLTASWSGNNGSGTATGKVAKTGPDGRALRIEWSNGVIFFR